ncbi:Stress response protein NST1 [Frankliniella fusca]|uniref:Stress response protein NST1 n=1 Tax=Frankliniella fusca TaxID=407009 RepID=A0AAE1HKR0_9NEOP|nr:Stress response protein NST1 [Frankliniella fusca]KAK3907234.1 Stress response protein NST1 [Frankliniella fusca]KAK3922456.1 Stress response protein NST1 [Frankliniella fusca]KAK3922461.1 Stress response protein NST1 [Frankliniella fusca]
MWFTDTFHYFCFSQWEWREDSKTEVQERKQDSKRRKKIEEERFNPILWAQFNPRQLIHVEIKNPIIRCTFLILPVTLVKVFVHDNKQHCHGDKHSSYYHIFFQGLFVIPSFGNWFSSHCIVLGGSAMDWHSIR